MGDFLNQVSERANIQQLCHFLLYGMESDNPHKLSHNQYLARESLPLFEKLKTMFEGNAEGYDEFTALLTQTLSAYETVYTEIGVKCGAGLIIELLDKSSFLSGEDKTE